MFGIFSELKEFGARICGCAIFLLCIGVRYHCVPEPLPHLRMRN